VCKFEEEKCKLFGTRWIFGLPYFLCGRGFFCAMPVTSNATSEEEKICKQFITQEGVIQNTTSYFYQLENYHHLFLMTSLYR
jgi:hypothetical protein